MKFICSFLAFYWIIFLHFYGWTFLIYGSPGISALLSVFTPSGIWKRCPKTATSCLKKGVRKKLEEESLFITELENSATPFGTFFLSRFCKKTWWRMQNWRRFLSHFPWIIKLHAQNSPFLHHSSLHHHDVPHCFVWKKKLFFYLENFRNAPS